MIASSLVSNSVGCYDEGQELHSDSRDGMKYIVNNMESRKEFVTGNLADFMINGELSCALVVMDFR